MSTDPGEITSGWTYTRDNYQTVDQPPRVPVTLTVGDEAATDPDHPNIGFVVWVDRDPLLVALVIRCPHYRGGYWPNRPERGYRVIEVSFTAKLFKDGGGDLVGPAVTDLATWPVGRGQAVIRRADVISEWSADAVYAVIPAVDQPVNYWHARNSMGVPY